MLFFKEINTICWPRAACLINDIQAFPNYLLFRCNTKYPSQEKFSTNFQPRAENNQGPHSPLKSN